MDPKRIFSGRDRRVSAGAVVMACLVAVYLMPTTTGFSLPQANREAPQPMQEQPAAAVANVAIATSTTTCANLLLNPVMEDGTSVPANWVRGQGVRGVEYLWDRSVGHCSSSSLCLKKTERRYFPIAEWSQDIGTTVPENASSIDVAAWVKAQDVMKAILDVQFIDAQGEWSHGWVAYIGNQSSTDTPLTHDWQQYGSRVPIPPGTRKAIVGLQIYGPGTVWFDDVTARFAGPNDPAPKELSGKLSQPVPSVRSATADSNTTALLNELRERIRAGKFDDLFKIGRAMGESRDPACIPTLIGAIDADNSYDTVYWLGYFGLCKLTGVKHSRYHDGAWWKRWWEKNKSRYPEAVRNQPIPQFPKSAKGANYIPFPDDLETTQGIIRQLESELGAGKAAGLELSGIADEMVRQKDPMFIPVLIGAIDADNSYATIYGLGYFGLGKLTGVKYSESHNGAWWRRWWEENKSKYPPHVQAMPIPDYRQALAEGRQKAKPTSGFSFLGFGR